MLSSGCCFCLNANLCKGKVQYFVEGCLDIPWSFDKEFKVEFPVVRRDDFSGQKDFATPQVKNVEVRSCLCCCSASLRGSVSIPHGVFTPSSAIPITIHSENGKMGNVDMKLKRIVYFRR
jgi:hypothetical protein